MSKFKVKKIVLIMSQTEFKILLMLYQKMFTVIKHLNFGFHPKEIKISIIIFNELS